ncbi:hypothetical protein [Caudoviricetes sp.]|nr:hypothetical protein [Caudoviricetes sp.]
MTTTLTNFPNGITIGGGNQRSTTAGVEGVILATFDPTSSTQILLGTLPAGAVPLDVVGYGGTTGGTNPTVDIGTVASSAGMANELDGDATASSAVAAGAAGALLGVQVTTPTAVYGKVGSSAGTGGPMKVAIKFIVLPY